MGRLADVEWGSASVCASCGEKKMTSHCCKDEAHYVKLAVDQDVNHVPVTNLLPAVTELLPVMYSAFIPLEAESLRRSVASFNFPPWQTDIPLFVHHCTYLISFSHSFSFGQKRREN